MKRLLLGILAVATILAVTLAVVVQPKFKVAYHQWRMNAAYDSVFADPRPTGDGMASFTPTTDDVDGALETYADHRQTLTNLGALVYLTESFPHLASDGSKEHRSLRLAFNQRLWAVFPNHRHYNMDRSGNFECWAAPSQKQAWQTFLDLERNIAPATPPNQN